MTNPQTLLEELHAINLALTEGIATTEQKCRGQHLTYLGNAAPDLVRSLRDVLGRFFSCISDGNGQIYGDAEAIAHAKAVLAQASGQEIPHWKYCLPTRICLDD